MLRYCVNGNKIPSAETHSSVLYRDHTVFSVREDCMVESVLQTTDYRRRSDSDLGTEPHSVLTKVPPYIHILRLESSPPRYMK